MAGRNWAMTRPRRDTQHDLAVEGKVMFAWVTSILVTGMMLQGATMAAAQADPAMIQADPAMIQADPAMIQADPAMIQADPAMIQADPAMIQADPAANTDPSAVRRAKIELNLLANFLPGMATPVEAPQLFAKLVTGKRIDCLKSQAAMISAADDTSAIEAAAAMVSALNSEPVAQCTGSYRLRGGLYSLQASYVAGANWATWKCYRHAPGAVGSTATAAAAPLFSSEAVKLVGGSNYTCIATYTPETPEQTAAIASIDWSKEVAVAASSAAESAAVAAPDSCPAPAYNQPPRGKPPPPLSVSGATITAAGTWMHLRGINWFGFNLDLGMLNGLWAGGKDAATDFSKIAYQLKMLGYNSVRIPFAFSFLAKTDVWNAVKACTALTTDQLKQRLIDPQVFNQNSRKVLPTNVSPMSNPAGQCNTYLPTRNNQDRLLFVVQQFVALGMYVILDYQPQGLEQHAYDLNKFVSSWVNLWKQVMCLPNFNSDIAGRVLIDVMNEPDSMGIRWEAQGGRPGAEQLYLATADALWAISPNNMLLMYEGTGQNMIGLNWGNGFVTDASLISSKGLSNPTSFFNQLVKKPYARRSVMSPHLYPPSITLSTWLGADLWKQSQVAFGYLQDKGFCASGTCTVFPVLVGETGSAYKEDSDKKWLQDFADFVYARGQAAAYNKKVINGWLWWAYNENSGDTGGIVMNNWQDINWDKMRYMINTLGLRPWYTLSATRIARRRPRNGRNAPNDTIPGDYESDLA